MEVNVLKLGHTTVRCFLAVGVMFLLGCGGDGITIVPVEGTVTLDGQPLERIMVEFWPESEGPRSFASTDEQGHFVLTTDDGKRQGAALGTHRITLKDMTVYNDKFLGRAAENMTNNSSGKKNRIADKYSLATSTDLRQVVEKGKENVFALEVEKKK